MSQNVVPIAENQGAAKAEEALAEEDSKDQANLLQSLAANAEKKRLSHSNLVETSRYTALTVLGNQREAKSSCASVMPVN